MLCADFVFLRAISKAQKRASFRQEPKRLPAHLELIVDQKGRFMNTNHQTEVLVAGAGPAGMMTALLLGEHGINVQLIDQESGAAARSYSCALHSRTLQLLDEAGVAADAIDLGWPIETIGIYEGNTRRCQLHLSALATDFPFLLVLPQNRLEDFLEKRIKQLPNVKLHWSRRLQDLQIGAQGVTATIDQLASTGKGYGSSDFEMAVDKKIELQTSFVVGADGHDSILRQRLGIQSETVGTPESFVVYEFETNAQAGHEMKIIFDYGLTSVMWPLAENRCRWSFQMALADPDKEFPGKDRQSIIVAESPSLEDGRHHLGQLLQERAPWFEGTIEEIAWSTDIQFEHRLAREFGRDRCWLVGDAAHQTGPVGAQSMNLGLGEAADLAAALNRILRHKGAMDLLQTYDRNHRAQWQKMLGMNGSPKTTGNTPPWARENSERILLSLPASGKELTGLLGKLGLEF
jgi:2-polyprenyl-6-methoxyphenol hydroxylase-like FAD-dependent oxidoreductase